MSNFLKLKQHVTHVNKDRVKASFDITVKKLTQLGDLNGKVVSFTWKRGKRSANAGSIKEVMVERGEAVWDEKFVVQATLFKEANGDKFEEKSLSVQINQGSKTIGKLRLNLGDIAKSDGSTIMEFPLAKKQGSPVLYITVHARWLKLNDRLLVRLEDGQGADHTNTTPPKPALEIDGQPYNLKTDDALTDPSVDTTSGSWEEEEEAKEHYGHQEHDPFTSVSVFEAETRKVQDELEVMRKQLRLVEGQSSERAKTIELQEKEILSLRQKVSENEELVARAMNMESFMDQQIALAKQEHEETVRALKEQHAKELEAEVDRHREELDTALIRAQLCLLSPSLPHNPPASSSASTSSTSASTGGELDSLKGERDALQKERDALLREKADLVREREAQGLKMRLVTREVEESAKSLVLFTEQLAERDDKIARLKDETKSLILSLQNVTRENQALKLASPSLSSSTTPSVLSPDLSLSDERSIPPPSSPSSSVTRTRKTFPPLFKQPFVNDHWGLLFLSSFGLLLVILHLLFSPSRVPLSCPPF